MTDRRVKDLKIHYLEGISPDTPLKNAWDYMVERSVRTLPVIDGSGYLCGVINMDGITSVYIDQKIKIPHDDIRNLPVGDIMIKEPLFAIDLENTVIDARSHAQNVEYDYYPVMDNQKKVMGVVSRLELLYRSYCH